VPQVHRVPTASAKIATCKPQGHGPQDCGPQVCKLQASSHKSQAAVHRGAEAALFKAQGRKL